MSTLHEAARRVVSAWVSTRPAWIEQCNEAVLALDAALKAQPEPAQEPVAWMVYTEGGTSAYVTDNPNDLVGAYRALPLYTAPPQRKPLTEEEIVDAVREADLDWQAGWTLDEHEPNRFTTLARAIERKVRGE